MRNALRARRRRTPRPMTAEVGERLLLGGAWGAQAAHALAAGVSTRTLRRWTRQAERGEEPKPWGRRPHPLALKHRVEALVKLERERQGETAGWRPIARALARARRQAPRRLIQEAL